MAPRAWFFTSSPGFTALPEMFVITQDLRDFSKGTTLKVIALSAVNVCCQRRKSFRSSEKPERSKVHGVWKSLLPLSFALHLVLASWSVSEDSWIPKEMMKFRMYMLMEGDSA